MKSPESMERKLGAAMLMLSLSVGYSTAQSVSGKYACSEPNPLQQCNASNTCGSAAAPCMVDVKRTGKGASTTASIPKAKSNEAFCVKAGTTVTWKSSAKDIGFLIDFGSSSPFEPSGPITGGSDRSVSVVAKKPGCYKYSAGACLSGEIYGMCGTGNAEIIVSGTN
jgi:plastocyanin